MVQLPTALTIWFACAIHSCRSTKMINDIPYANADYIPNAQQYIEQWATSARAYRETEAAIGRARLNVPYGPQERQKLDLFHPSGAASGLVVFVHGGYWLRFDRGYWSHLAAGCCARGWAVAMPSYPLAPDAQIGDITKSVASAIEKAAGLIRGPIVLTGHSAGGQLVARMACRDVVLESAVAGRISRILPVSPVADLRPLLSTSMNSELRLDAVAAEIESPVLHPVPEIPVSVWVGAEERPAFLDQARWLTKAWRTRTRIAPGRHHFDVIELMQDPTTGLVEELVQGFTA